MLLKVNLLKPERLTIWQWLREAMVELLEFVQMRRGAAIAKRYRERIDDGKVVSSVVVAQVFNRHLGIGSKLFSDECFFKDTSKYTPTNQVDIKTLPRIADQFLEMEMIFRGGVDLYRYAGESKVRKVMTGGLIFFLAFLFILSFYLIDTQTASPIIVAFITLIGPIVSYLYGLGPKSASY